MCMSMSNVEMAAPKPSIPKHCEVFAIEVLIVPQIGCTTILKPLSLKHKTASDVQMQSLGTLRTASVTQCHLQLQLPPL